MPYFLALLADTCRELHRPAEGLGLLADALERVRRTRERWFEAELHRLRGEALLRIAADVPARPKPAFARRIAVARRAGCQLGGSCARRPASPGCGREQGERPKAHDLLAPVYGWFTEGFDTAGPQGGQGAARRAGLGAFFAGLEVAEPRAGADVASALRAGVGSSPVGLKRPMLPMNCSKAFISEPEVGVSRSTKLTSCASSSPCRSILVTVPSSSKRDADDVLIDHVLLIERHALGALADVVPDRAVEGGERRWGAQQLLHLIAGRAPRLDLRQRHFVEAVAVIGHLGYASEQSGRGEQAKPDAGPSNRRPRSCGSSPLLRSAPHFQFVKPGEAWVVNTMRPDRQSPPLRLRARRWLRRFRPDAADRARREVAERVYRDLVKQARTPLFYRDLGVPDTPEGRFEMVGLHAALVVRRLRSAGAPGSALAQELFDLLFADVDEGLRHIGIGDLAVGKHVRRLAGYFYARLRAPGRGAGRRAGCAARPDAAHQRLSQRGRAQPASAGCAGQLPDHGRGGAAGTPERAHARR